MRGATIHAYSAGGLWSTATWTNSVPLNAPGDIASYSSPSAACVTLDSAVTIGQLTTTYSGNWIINPGAGAFTFDNTGGATNSFGDANAAIAVTAGGNLTVAPAIVLGTSPLDIGTTSTGGVALQGGITGTGNVNVITQGSGSITLNALLMHGTLNQSGTGAGSLIVADALGANVSAITMTAAAGQMFLAANNGSFSTLTIANGTVAIASDANLGASTSAIVFSGTGLSTLAITGTGLASFDSHAVTFGSGAAVGIDLEASGATFTQSQALNQQTGSFDKMGQGTLTLRGANTYSGATLLHGGTLQIDMPDGGSLAASTHPTFLGGTLAITGAAASSQSFAGIILGGTTNGVYTTGGGTFVLNAPSAGNTLAVSLGSITATTAGATLDIECPGAGAVTLTTTSTKDSTGIYSPRITFNGADWLSSASTGSPYTLSAYTGYSALSACTTDSLNTRITSNATITANHTTNTLKIADAPTAVALSITAGKKLTLTAGGLLVTGTHSDSITGGTLASGTATNSDLIVQDFAAAPFTIAAVIADGNGTSTLTKAGTGTLILTGTNTYSGGTFIDGGTLSVNNDARLGGQTGTISGSINSQSNILTLTSSTLPAGFGVGSEILGENVVSIVSKTVTLSGNVSSSSSGTLAWATDANITLNGGTLQTTGSFVAQEANGSGATQNRALILGGAGGTIDLINGSTFALNGPILSYDGTGAGHAALTVTSSDQSAGVLTLNNAGTFGDGLNINGGTVRLEAVGALNTNGSNIVTFGPTSAGRLQLEGNRISVAGLNSDAASAIVESGGNSIGAAALIVTTAADDHFAGTLQDGSVGVGGSLALIKNGAAALTLTGNNTYTGGTTLNGGTLVAGNAISSLGTGAVTLNGGTLASTDGGVIAGSVVAGIGPHTIAPGGMGTVGSMVIGGNLTLNANSTLNFDLGDVIHLTGNASLLNATGTTAIDIVGTPTAATYDLITGITGGSATAGSFTLAAPTAGYAIELSDGTLSLSQANAAAAVPEPASIGFTVIGAIGLLPRCKRRRG